MTLFIPGLDLSARLYSEGVRPVLDRSFPGLVHAAALLDRGSEVLGFDTAQSMDHDWGPRLTLFVPEGSLDDLAPRIDAALGRELPFEIAGISTHFDELEEGGKTLRTVATRPLRHGVRVTSIRGFARAYLGLEIRDDADVRITASDWMALPWQRLATLQAGRVHHDGDGQLSGLRAALAWYPRDVWLHVLACQWRRIDQHEPFVGRSGDVGDELGSRLIGVRQVRELMQLLFLIERRFAPYAKWFGSAFSRLDCAAEMAPLFDAVLRASNWADRETALSAAYLAVGRRFNARELVESVELRIASFHERPYLVPHSGRFVDALRGAIRDPDVLALPEHVGSLDQFIDSTEVDDETERFREVGSLFRGR